MKISRTSAAFAPASLHPANKADARSLSGTLTQATARTAAELATSFKFVITYATPEYWRVTINNPPFDVFGQGSIPQLNSIIKQIEEDPKLKVVVFESAIPGIFLTHYDFDQPLERHILLMFYLGDALAIGHRAGGAASLEDVLAHAGHDPAVAGIDVATRMPI